MAERIKRWRRIFSGPVFSVFVDRDPGIEIDLTVTNKMVDVIGEVHDAGIRFVGSVPKDMIAQQLSPDVAWTRRRGSGLPQSFYPLLDLGIAIRLLVLTSRNDKLDWMEAIPT